MESIASSSSQNMVPNNNHYDVVSPFFEDWELITLEPKTTWDVTFVTLLCSCHCPWPFRWSTLEKKRKTNVGQSNVKSNLDMHNLTKFSPRTTYYPSCKTGAMQFNCVGSVPKACRCWSVIFLDQTPTFDRHEVRQGSKNKHHKGTYLTILK